MSSEAMNRPVAPGQILTSGQATIWYLRRYLEGRRVYLLGNHLLAREFCDADVELDGTNPSQRPLSSASIRSSTACRWLTRAISCGPTYPMR